MTINESVEQIGQARIAMANSINAQGGTVESDTPLTEYAEAILSISSPNKLIPLTYASTITLEDSKSYSLTLTGDVTFTLPTITADDRLHTIFVQLNMPEVHSIALGTTQLFNRKNPDVSAAGTYDLFYEYDQALSSWVAGIVKKGEVENA